MPRVEREVEPEICPFTIVIDTNEAAPFHFTGIAIDGDKHGRSWIVNTVKSPLFTMARREVEIHGDVFVKGLADYAIFGHELAFEIERKSIADLYSTLGQRRLEFEAEIKRLHEDCEFAAVVIEGDWEAILRTPPNSQLNPKSVSRTILSWSVRYPRVHWFPCMNRRHAEMLTFQLMMKWWEQREAREEENAPEAL